MYISISQIIKRTELNTVYNIIYIIHNNKYKIILYLVSDDDAIM